MKATLIHGDNQVVSRRLLTDNIAQAKLNGHEVVNLNGPKITLTQLVEALEAQSFFNSNRLVVIENLHLHPSKTTLAQILAYIKTYPGPYDLVLWHKAALKPAQVKALATFQIKDCKASAVVFDFLRALVPGRIRMWLPLFDQACQKDSPEFVYAMLIRHLRQLIMSEDPKAKGAPWQLQQLRAQNRSFTPAKVIDLYTQLAEFDYKFKTGRLQTNLQAELRFLLANVCT
jgi:DNA polymerase III delta subunit